jgi:hypothetical protein
MYNGEMAATCLSVSLTITEYPTMNTKIVVQRLANVVHSRAKASVALIKMDSGTLHCIKLGLVTAVLFASAYVAETKALLAILSADS